MSSSIIIGSLIACKLLLSPMEEKALIDNQQNNNSNIAMNRLLESSNRTNSQESPQFKEIVLGEVVSIEEKDIWVTNPNNGKIFKDKKRMLKIKADNIVDLLVVSEAACVLKEELIEEKADINQKQDKKEESYEVNTGNIEYEEEYIIVPLDYDLKENENLQEVKSEELKKKLDDALSSYLKKNDYNVRTREESEQIRIKLSEEKRVLSELSEKQKRMFIEEKKEPETIIEENNLDSEFIGEEIVAKMEEEFSKKNEIVKEKIVEEINIKEKSNKNIKKENIVKNEDYGKKALISKAISIILKEW